MGSENVIISSISRIPNKDYSVVKTLGPDPSSSTVDFLLCWGTVLSNEGRAAFVSEMELCCLLYKKTTRTFEPYYLDITSDKKR